MIWRLYVMRRAIEYGLAGLTVALLGIAEACMINHCRGGSPDPRCVFGVPGWATVYASGGVTCTFDPDLLRQQRQER